MRINVAAITNISRDHLDYHKNLKNYKKIKLQLLTKYLKINGYAVVNSNIKISNKIKKILYNKSISLLTYGSSNSDINIIKKSIKLY